MARTSTRCWYLVCPSTGEPSNGFDGVFHIEAVSLEGGSDARSLDGVRSYNPSRDRDTENGYNDYGDYAVESADLPVQFLQPATVPTLDVDLAAADSSMVEFTMEIGPETTDIVTILATKVPEGLLHD